MQPNNDVESQQIRWRLYNTLERARRFLDINHSAWASLMGLTPQEYESAYRRASPKISVKSLCNLADALDLTVEALLVGDVDLPALHMHLHGHGECLPEKYAVAAYGKIESATNILSYAQFRENDAGTFRSRAMKRLQLTEKALSNPDRPINIRLVEDLTRLCREQGFQDDDFIMIGRNRSLFNSQRVRKSLLSVGMLGSPAQVYERCIADFPNLQEKIYLYSLTKLESEHCVIKSVTNEEVAEQMKRKVYGNPEICLIRMGLTMVAPRYGNFSMARVRKTACIHQGDPCCLIEADFSNSKKVLAH